MAIWHRQFVPGAEIVADDGWHGIVQEQQHQHVVAVAVGYEPNDYLEGYRTFIADTLESMGGGEWLDRRSAPVEPCRQVRRAVEWPPRRAAACLGVGACARAPTLPAQPRQHTKAALQRRMCA